MQPSGDTVSKAIRKSNLTTGVVAFIDMLGYSARVRNVSTQDALLALDKDVTLVQREFEHKPNEETTREVKKFSRKTVLAFSDCLVVSVPVRSPEADQIGDFDVIMSELTGLAFSQCNCIFKNVFLRGGVDFGMWFRRRDTIISPALVNAYGLEREANVPIIAVTEDLYAYLAKHPQRRQYHEDIDPIRRTFRRTVNLPNGKEHWFIDYAGICLNEIDGAIPLGQRAAYHAASMDERERMSNETLMKNRRGWARQHACAIVKAHSETTRDDVRAKYAWLANYHNETIETWFGGEIGDLKAKIPNGICPR
jgi:hypothetical protein